MDKSLILNEIGKNLPNLENVSYSMEDDAITVKIEDRDLLRIDENVIAYIGDIDDKSYPDEFDEIMSAYKHTKGYLLLIENAEKMNVHDFDSKCKKILEFNDVVLAGIEKSNSVEFVTWLKNNRGYTLGHYFGNNIDAAKEDFAIRSNLIDSNKIFTNEELIEISRCVDDTLGGGYELTTEQKDMLEDIKDSIKNAVPNYDELVRPDEEQGMEQMM